MKRSFPSTAREAFRVLVRPDDAALAVACTPNQGVKPGAPELIEFTIVQGGRRRRRSGRTRPIARPGSSPGTPAVASGRMADAADGGTLDAESRPTVRAGSRASTTNNWCTCVADGMDPNVGTWNCDPFANVTAVIAMFDRLLDTAPFDPGTARGHGRHDDFGHAASRPPSTSSGLLGDGRPHGLVFTSWSVLRQLPGRRPQPVRRAGSGVPVGRDRDGRAAGRQGAREGRQDAVRGQRPAARRHRWSSRWRRSAAVAAADLTRWRWTRTP